MDARPGLETICSTTIGCQTFDNRSRMTHPPAPLLAEEEMDVVPTALANPRRSVYPRWHTKWRSRRSRRVWVRSGHQEQSR